MVVPVISPSGGWKSLPRPHIKVHHRDFLKTPKSSSIPGFLLALFCHGKCYPSLCILTNHAILASTSSTFPRPLQVQPQSFSAILERQKYSLNNGASWTG